MTEMMMSFNWLEDMTHMTVIRHLADVFRMISNQNGSGSVQGWPEN